MAGSLSGSAALSVCSSHRFDSTRDPADRLPAPRETFRFAEVYGEKLGRPSDPRVADGPGPATLRRGSTSPPRNVAIPLGQSLLPVLSGDRAQRAGATGHHGVLDSSVGFPSRRRSTRSRQALGADLQTEVAVLRIGKGTFAFLPTEVDPQIATGYRAQMRRGGHTSIVGLASDELGYQVPLRSGTTAATRARRSSWRASPGCARFSRSTAAPCS